MESLYFLEYPDRDSEVGFVVVDYEGTTNPLRNDAEANQLETALQIAEVEDPQADIMIDLLKKGIVAKKNVKDLDDFLNAPDPCMTLFNGLLGASDAGKVTDEDAERLTNSVYKLNDYFIQIANIDGLQIDKTMPDSKHTLVIYGPEHMDRLKNDHEPEIVSVARVVEANAYCYQTLVSWSETGADLLTPKLSPPNETITFGMLRDEKFSPLLSVIPR